MVITPALRQIMSDKVSLTDYWQGRLPQFDDIKRRLFLRERQFDTSLPDHYYQRGRDFSMNGIDTLAGLLTEGLRRLGDHHLELIANRIKVKREAWPCWQDLLTLSTPLPLICAVLWDKKFEKGTCDVGAIADFATAYIDPNTRYTCLPSPEYPALERLRHTRGFCDLHLHLNGSTETDTAWQMFLKRPYAVYKELYKVRRESKVKELFEQEAFGVQRPLDVYKLLRIAQTIRRAMVNELFFERKEDNRKSNKKRTYDKDCLDDIACFQACDITVCLKCARQLSGVFFDIARFSSIHPMQNLFDPLSGHNQAWSDSCLEALMYVLIMDRLSFYKSTHLAGLFHYYLLILGFINRFLVQQMHQNGFDQFQKITLNGFREPVEKTFQKRFFQMHGNRLTNLSLLEGRFSPKKSTKENMKQFNRIFRKRNVHKDYFIGWLEVEKQSWLKDGHAPQLRFMTDIGNRKTDGGIGGWQKFIDQCRWERQHSHPDAHLPELRLVAHFIKEKDKEKLSDFPNPKIRHKKLRMANWKKARALVRLLENDSAARHYITGVDTAANELEAPPEVFAPVYRYLRRKGIQHFTYHAGEDFHHLAGGLRAVYEAVEFLGLRQGDRIGHATAAGIDPEIWLRHVGKEFVISQGEWLDDMLFVLHMLGKYPQSPLNQKLSVVLSEMDRHAQQVYKKHYTASSHTRAWLLRRFCPMHILNCQQDDSKISSWSYDEWKLCVKEKERADKDTLDLLKLYHREDYRKRYHKKISLDILSVLSKKDFSELQNLVLKELSQKEIVLEVLPTSNVRISFYKNHGEHHLFRWLGVANESIRPEVLPLTVVGSDDPGIFSTNIFNEYCHIYHQLVYEHNQSHEKALTYIRRLMENADIYAFQSNGDLKK
ncbi:MAG: hypothetical protein PVI90_19295 [Desulfobacteraceae bacterium]|jgi:hypothetical protein